MIDQVSELLDAKTQVVEREVPSEVKNYVIDTWGNPEKLIQAGFKPVFTDHTANLRFINEALSDIKGYWSSVEEIRKSLA